MVRRNDRPGRDDLSVSAVILGVRVDLVERGSLLQQAMNWRSSDRPRTIFYANARTVNYAYEHKDFRDQFNQADLIYADGVSVAWAGRTLSQMPYVKLTGADWIADFGRLAASLGLRIYLVGGAPGIAAQAGQILQARYPGLQVIGASDGFFKDKSIRQVLQEIHEARPDLVFVGMGTPAQERWISSNRSEIQAPVCWAVGALFDFIAGAEKRAPGWMNRLGLEWLWRLLMDPLGKWKRYVLGNPQFVYRVLRQKYFS